MQSTIPNGKHTALHAKLTGSSFTDVCLGGATFHDVNLGEATFHDVNLAGARFDDVNLSGVAIGNANLDGMRIDGILVSELLLQQDLAVSRLRVNRSMPPSIIIPVLAYDDVSVAVAWLCGAFGCVEHLRIGTHRTQLTFGTAFFVASDTQGQSTREIGRVMVRVPDAEAHHDRARRAGAEIISPPSDYPYGERQYTARDPGGHRWTFSQTITDVDPATWGGTLIGE